jgi:hypothetical protein
MKETITFMVQSWWLRSKAAEDRMTGDFNYTQ